MDKKIVPAREYFSKKNSDIINFPVQLRREIFSPKARQELLAAPITTMRIIFKVLNDISNDQFLKQRQKQQFALFEDDFLTDDNVVAKFTFDVKDIDEYRDYKAIQKGLEFLEGLDKGWHKTVNSKGKTIKAYGGVIIQPNISDSKITFLMSNTWISKFLSLGVYNPVFLDTAWKLTKIKQVLFYLWLIEVPDGGTRVKYQTFNEAYGYNYKTAQLIGKHVLKNLRLKLNKVSNVSFNYSTKGDLIYITPYYVKDTELDLDEKTVTNQHITQKLHYWKKRHKLKNAHIASLKTIIRIQPSDFGLLVNAYGAIVEDCKISKKKVTDYQGEEFIKLFNEKIVDAYKSTAWFNTKLKNAYPVIEVKGIEEINQDVQENNSTKE